MCVCVSACGRVCVLAGAGVRMCAHTCSRVRVRMCLCVRDRVCVRTRVLTRERACDGAHVCA